MIATPFAGDRIRLIGHPVSAEKRRWMFYPAAFLCSQYPCHPQDNHARNLSQSSPLPPRNHTPLGRAQPCRPRGLPLGPAVLSPVSEAHDGASDAA